MIPAAKRVRLTNATVYTADKTYWIVQTDPATKLARSTRWRYATSGYMLEVMRGARIVEFTPWKKLPISAPPMFKRQPPNMTKIVQYTGPLDEPELFQ